MTLKDLRKSRGIYPSFVAMTLDISVRHFHRIENAEGYLTKDRARKLAKLYGVKVSEIQDMYGGEIHG